MARIRIISGSLGRRLLNVPSGMITRPTSDRVREAMFNMIQSRIDIVEASVLDLFAGTGALGIEAISRGADHAVFVESHPLSLAANRENAKSLTIEERCTFVRADVRDFLDRPQDTPYDIILADPPYDLPYLEMLPDLVMPHLSPGGLFVLEHDRRIDFAGRDNLEISRSYGRTSVSVFNQREQDA